MAKGKSKGSALRDDILTIKRERILSEAVELFYRDGYLPTNVDAIAQQFGATKPFVYYHFKSKIELLSEICRRMMTEAVAVAEAASRSEGAPVEKLAQFVASFTDLVLDQHKRVSIYFREELNLPDAVKAEIAGMRKQIASSLRRILEDGAKSGAFHMSSVAAASQIVAGMVSYTFAWYDESGSLTRPAIRQQMFEQVLMSVGVAPEVIADLAISKSA